MNKKFLIVTALVLIVAVVVVLVISNSYPENEEELAAGSIGKVEKHNEANVQGYDIELRSDFIKDDAQIKLLVRDLTYYYVTMNRLSYVLSSINYPNFCGKLPDNSGNICDKLMDLREFVDNNREKLKTSIETFAAAFDNDDPPTSDVENQMIQIADFHIQFMKRNDILNEVIKDLDRVIDNPQNSKNFENMNDVIQLRDLLLITNLDIASIVGDKKNYEFATDQKIRNTDIIKDISSNNLKVSPFLVYSNSLGIGPANMFGDMQKFVASQEGIKMIFGNLVTDENIQKFLTPAINANKASQGYQSMIIGNSKLEIVIPPGYVDLNFINNMDHSNKLIVILGGTDDLKVYSEVKDLSFFTPYGVYGITQNMAIYSSQEDMNNFISQGQLSIVFSNEKILNVMAYGIGDLNSSLGIFMSLPASII